MKKINKIHLKGLLILALLFILGCNSSDDRSANGDISQVVIQTNNPQGPPQGFSNRVQIIRDENGLIHNFANTFAGACYGNGYSNAADHALEYLLIHMAVSGNTHKYLDSNLLGMIFVDFYPGAFKWDDDNIIPYENARAVTPLDFAKNAYFYGLPKNSERAYEELNKEEKACLDHYVHGFNYYIANKKSELFVNDPRAIFFDNAGALEFRITPQSAIGTMMNTFFAPMARETFLMVKDAMEVKLNTNNTNIAGVDLGGNTLAALNVYDPFFEEELGKWKDKVLKKSYPHKILTASNEWVIDGAHTNTKKPLLMLDPHLPYYGAYSMIGVHMDGGETNFAGSAFFGWPLAIIGFNQNISWTFTANQVDVSDIYLLSLNPLDENQYFNYKTNNYEDIETEVIQIPGPNGSSVDFEIRKTEFGKVLFNDGIRAFSQRHTLEGINPFKQLYRMARAKTMKEWRDAMSLKGLPYFHGMASSSEGKNGDIHYIYNARTTKRNNEFGYFNKIVDSTKEENDWQRDREGNFIFYTDQEIPQIGKTQAGFLVGNNASPNLVSLDNNIDLEKIPVVIHGSYVPYTHARQERGIEMLSKEVLINDSIDSNDMIRMSVDTYNYSGREETKRYRGHFDRIGNAVLSPGEYANANRVLHILEDWDKMASKESTVQGFFEYIRQIKLRDVPLKVRQDHLVASGFADPDQENREYGPIILRALSTAFQEYMAINGEFKSWEEQNFLFNLTETYPISGCGDCLRAVGDRFGGIYSNGVFLTTGGQTFTMIVQQENREAGFETEAFLMKPVHGSLRSNAPWFFNLSQKFSDEEFVKYPFKLEDFEGMFYSNELVEYNLP